MMLGADFAYMGTRFINTTESRAPDEYKDMIDEARKRRMSRGVNHPTPGVASFSAPVFDYSGNIALAVTILGPTGTFDVKWDGPVAKALRTCTEAISKRLGHRGT